MFDFLKKKIYVHSENVDFKCYFCKKVSHSKYTYESGTNEQKKSATLIFPCEHCQKLNSVHYIFDVSS